MLSSPGRERSALCRRFFIARLEVSLQGPGAPACVASAFGLHTGMYLVNVYSVFKVLGGDVAGGSCDLGTCLLVLSGGSR